MIKNLFLIEIPKNKKNIFSKDAFGDGKMLYLNDDHNAFLLRLPLKVALIRKRCFNS